MTAPQTLVPQTTVPQEMIPQKNQITIQTTVMEMNRAECPGTTQRIQIPQVHPPAAQRIRPKALRGPAVQAEEPPQRPAAQADIRGLMPRGGQARSRM